MLMGSVRGKNSRTAFTYPPIDLFLKATNEFLEKIPRPTSDSMKLLCRTFTKTYYKIKNLVPLQMNEQLEFPLSLK